MSEDNELPPDGEELETRVADHADASGTSRDTDADDAFDSDLTDAMGDALLDEDEPPAGEHADEPGPQDDLNAIMGDDDDFELATRSSTAQPRNAKGEFAKAPEAGKPGDTPAVGDATGDTANLTATATPVATPAAVTEDWAPLALRHDKAIVPIDEARVSRANGHYFVAVPDKDYPRFQQRLSRGFAFERARHAIEAKERELDAKLTAAPRQSDAEIEAQLYLELMKPHLADIFDEQTLENLDLRVQLAQRKAATDYASQDAQRVAEANAPAWEDAQLDHLREQTLNIIQSTPALHVLTEDDVRELWQKELLPYRNSLIFRNGDDIFANTELLAQQLHARAQARAAARIAPSPATPANTANLQATATPVAAKPDAADRFNRGVDTAASRPRTTSLKAGRTATRPPSGNTRGPGAAPATARRPLSTSEQRIAAEDRHRKAERAFMTSSGLDFELPEE
jgi:hypothetical protein